MAYKKQHHGCPNNPFPNPPAATYYTLDVCATNGAKVTTETVHTAPRIEIIPDLGKPSLAPPPKPKGTPTMRTGILKKKGLTPLSDWNEKVKTARAKALEPKGNGLACPTCGSELMDSTPGQSSTQTISGPFTSTTTPVHCGNPKCFFRSFREC